MSSTDTAPIPPVPAKVEITLDGPDVTRAISITDVRAYMTRKGFRLGTRDGARPKGSEMHLLAPLGEFTMSTPVVTLYDCGADDPDFMRPVVVAIAKCLDRDCSDVLREIAGEVVTLEDAWTALFVVLGAAGIDDGDNLDERDANTAADYASKWRTIARRQIAGSKGVKDYTRIAHAAEDLASIALAELRSKRATTPGESS